MKGQSSDKIPSGKIRQLEFNDCEFDFRLETFEESDGFLLGMSVQQCEIGVCQRTSEIVKEIFPGSKTITARVLSGITPAQRTKLLHVKEENGLPLQRLEGIMILKLKHQVKYHHDLADSN